MERISKDSNTLMRENGLRSKTMKKYKATTNSKHNYPVYPNLLNQFQVDKPGTVWVSNTYVWTMEGYLYLATVMSYFQEESQDGI